MTRFDHYMLAQLMKVFGFFALVLVLVYWINRAVLLFDQLIADGQSAAVFVEFTLLSLPNVIRLVLPMAAVAAAIYVTNRLSQDSELVAMQATGYGPFRLARPVLYFGVIVADAGGDPCQCHRAPGRGRTYGAKGRDCRERRGTAPAGRHIPASDLRD